MSDDPLSDRLKQLWQACPTQVRVLLIPVDPQLTVEEAAHAHAEMSAILPLHQVVFVAGMRGSATEITYDQWPASPVSEVAPDAARS